MLKIVNKEKVKPYVLHNIYRIKYLYHKTKSNFQISTK